jgi:tetratricopeptide (TPR) repeat protein
VLELVFFITVTVIFWRLLTQLETVQGQLAPRKVSPQLTYALDYAERLYNERKYVAAEKAYVGVLKHDHKNLQAYNRLGIIYSAQKNFADAIESFEVATRLLPSATTYLNLGLAYYDNRNYIKSIAALRKAIMFEPSVQRYVALAKACDKIADSKGVIEALEKAVELEPTRQTLTLLRDAYSHAGKKEQLAAITERLKRVSPGKPVRV